MFADFCSQAVATLDAAFPSSGVAEVEYRRRCSASEFATCVQALRLWCKQAPKESNDVVVYFAPEPQVHCAADGGSSSKPVLNACTRVVLTPAGAVLAVDVKTELLRHRVLQDGYSNYSNGAGSLKSSKWCSAVVSSERSVASNSGLRAVLVDAAQRALSSVVKAGTGTLVKKQVRVESVDDISHFVSAVNNAPPDPQLFSAVRWVGAASSLKPAKSRSKVVASLPVCAAGSLHPFAAWVAVLKPPLKQTDNNNDNNDKKPEAAGVVDLITSPHSPIRPLSIRHRHRISFTFEHATTTSGQIRVDCTVANGRDYSVEVEMPCNNTEQQQHLVKPNALDLIAPPIYLQALLLANLSTHRLLAHPDLDKPAEASSSSAEAQQAVEPTSYDTVCSGEHQTLGKKEKATKRAKQPARPRSTQSRSTRPRSTRTRSTRSNSACNTRENSSNGEPLFISEKDNASPDRSATASRPTRRKSKKHAEPSEDNEQRKQVKRKAATADARPKKPQ